MLLDDLNALSAVRFAHAKECLHDAKHLLEISSYKSAANRAYYAVFHAMRAVLALDEFDSSKHSGIIAEFRRRYIATHILDVSLSNIIGNTSDIRNASDYNDFFVISKAETHTQVENAATFIAAIEAYLQTK